MSLRAPVDAVDIGPIRGEGERSGNTGEKLGQSPTSTLVGGCPSFSAENGRLSETADLDVLVSGSVDPSPLADGGHDPGLLALTGWEIDELVLKQRRLEPAGM
jgi:hypothetical protein